jgi:hypothetical protein
VSISGEPPFCYGKSLDEYLARKRAAQASEPRAIRAAPRGDCGGCEWDAEALDVWLMLIGRCEG